MNLNITDFSVDFDIEYLKKDFSLFRFRSCNEYSYMDLINQTITLSSPNTFNDPYDSTVLNEYMIEKNKSGNGLTNEVIDDLNYSIDRGYQRQIRNYIRVASLSLKVNNELMWTHYANLSKGFAVEYSILEIERVISESKENTIYLSPVIYKNRKIKFKDGTDEEREEQMYKHIPILKNKLWGYENEWRIISKTNIHENQYEILKNVKPKGIYVGESISEYNMIILCSISIKLNVPIYKMVNYNTTKNRVLKSKKLSDSFVNRYANRLKK